MVEVDGNGIEIIVGVVGGDVRVAVGDNVQHCTVSVFINTVSQAKVFINTTSTDKSCFQMLMDVPHRTGNVDLDKQKIVENRKLTVRYTYSTIVL